MPTMVGMAEHNQWRKSVILTGLRLIRLMIGIRGNYHNKISSREFLYFVPILLVVFEFNRIVAEL